jgi:uncharacterized protein (TIGR02118 family)
MVKLVYCFKKSPTMSHSEFSEYWENVHGPIGARIPGLRKLVQSVVLEPHPGHKAPDYDGMAELWFDDVAALMAARESVEWAASSADEYNFIDPERTAYFVTEERIIVDSH